MVTKKVTRNKSYEPTVTDYSEARLQQDCVRWYKNTHCLAHHAPRSLILSVPNENKLRLAQMGGYAGASDLIVVHRQKIGIMRVIFIEVKTPLGRQSPAQRKFEEHVRSMGLEYYIVRSLEDFQQIINKTI